MNVYEIIQNLESSQNAALQHQNVAFANYREDPSPENQTALAAAVHAQQVAMSRLETVREAVQEQTQTHGIPQTHQQIIQQLDSNYQAASREGEALGQATITDGSQRAMDHWTSSIERQVVLKEALETVRELSNQERERPDTRENLTKVFLQDPTRENEKKLHDYLDAHSVSGRENHTHSTFHAHPTTSHSSSAHHHPGADHGGSSHAHSDASHSSQSHD